MKAYIRKHIAAGWTEQQIKDGLVAQLGPGVLGVPGKHGFDLLAWLIPFLGIAAGAAAIAGGAWVWSRNRDDPGAPSAPGGPALAPSLERRVDEELARFDEPPDRPARASAVRAGHPCRGTWLRSSRSRSSPG